MHLVNPHQEIPQPECIGPEIRLAENIDPAAAVQGIGTELRGHTVEIQSAHAGEIFQQPVQSPAPVIRRGIGCQGAETDRSEPFPVLQIGLGEFRNADVAFAPVIVIRRRVAQRPRHRIIVQFAAVPFLIAGNGFPHFFRICRISRIEMDRIIPLDFVVKLSPAGRTVGIVWISVPSAVIDCPAAIRERTAGGSHEDEGVFRRPGQFRRLADDLDFHLAPVRLPDCGQRRASFRSHPVGVGFGPEHDPLFHAGKPDQVVFPVRSRSELDFRPVVFPRDPGRSHGILSEFRRDRIAEIEIADNRLALGWRDLQLHNIGAVEPQTAFPIQLKIAGFPGSGQRDVIRVPFGDFSVFPTDGRTVQRPRGRFCQQRIFTVGHLFGQRAGFEFVSPAPDLKTFRRQFFHRNPGRGNGMIQSQMRGIGFRIRTAQRDLGGNLPGFRPQDIIPRGKRGGKFHLDFGLRFLQPNRFFGDNLFFRIFQRQFDRHTLSLQSFLHGVVGRAQIQHDGKNLRPVVKIETQAQRIADRDFPMPVENISGGDFQQLSARFQSSG